MGFEGQSPEERIVNPKLRQALASLGKAVFESSNQQHEAKEFETETAFHVRVEFDNKNNRTVRLSKNGNTATFTLNNDKVTFITLRDPDDKHLNDQSTQKQFTEEIQRLVQNKELGRFNVDDNGQYEMNV